MTDSLLYWYGVFMGSLLVGAFFGLLPLGVGLKFGKKDLAIVGFVCCVAAGFVWGIYLSIPCSLGFTIAILVFRKKKPETENRTYVQERSWNGSQEGCPWYRPGTPGNPPGCQWHGQNGPFCQQNPPGNGPQEQRTPWE